MERRKEKANRYNRALSRLLPNLRGQLQKEGRPGKWDYIGVAFCGTGVRGSYDMGYVYGKAGIGVGIGATRRIYEF